MYDIKKGYELAKELLTHPSYNTHERLKRQSAYSVAQVARKLYQSGVCTSDSAMVPTYLRPSQAERERNERLKQENKQ